MMQRLLTLFLLLLFGIAGQSLADTVLVLPFHNGSASSNLNWIGESLAESVRESMAEEGVMVLGREDRVEAYRRLTLRPEAFLTRASIISWPALSTRKRSSTASSISRPPRPAARPA